MELFFNISFSKCKMFKDLIKENKKNVLINEIFIKN